MELGLKGKIALVTASSKGIGKGIAKSLGKEGAQVIISSSNPTNLEETRKELEREEIKVFSFVCDLSKPEDVKNLGEYVINNFGKIDIFVFNTGGPKPGYFFEISDEDWYKGLELVLMSAVRLTRKFLPKMIENNWGRIVYMTSVSVKEPIDELLLSNVFRSSLNSFSKSLSRTIKNKNITFNVVCTGNIYTERAMKLLELRSRNTNKPFEEIKKEMEESIPLGRYGKVDEIADFVTFLCSEKASYINGTSIQVDGGFIRGVF
ncbi:MAG: SDR family oxidoreductase [Brevinematia bacterium]